MKVGGLISKLSACMPETVVVLRGVQDFNEAADLVSLPIWTMDDPLIDTLTNNFLLGQEAHKRGEGTMALLLVSAVDQTDYKSKL